MSDETTDHESTPKTGASRRRWPLILSGVAVLAVAAVTATALSGGFTADKQDKQEAVKVPGTDLPPLDPDMRYTFEDLEAGDDSDPTKASKAYREAFWGYLDEHFPGNQNHAIVEPEYADPKELDGDTMLGKEVDGAKLVRTMSGLAEWRYDKPDKSASTFERNTGYKRPYFQMSGTAANNLPDYTQFPGRKFADGMSLRVYPTGSFASGVSCRTALSGVQLIDCCKSDSGGSDDSKMVKNCDTDTTGDGDKVLTVKHLETTDDDGKRVKYRQTNTVALIRESDGVGIVVSDESTINRNEEEASNEGAAEPYPLDDPDDATPALGLDDLTDLAKALPRQAVK